MTATGSARLVALGAIGIASIAAVCVWVLARGRARSLPVQRTEGTALEEPRVPSLLTDSDRLERHEGPLASPALSRASEDIVDGKVNILVRAWTQSGAPLEKGLVDCAWSAARTGIDASAPIKRLEEATVGGSVLIRLPADAQSARVTIFADGFSSQSRDELLLTTPTVGEHAEDAQKTRLVEFHLTPTEAGAFLRGHITLDGISVCPQGLNITAIPIPQADKPQDGTSKAVKEAARINIQKATYEVGPLDPDARWGLWIVSLEARPEWIIAPPLADAPGQPDFNIRCSRGPTLVIQAIREASNAAAPGEQLELTLSIPVWRTDEWIHRREQRFAATTDDRGVCRFASLPAEGQITVDWIRPLPKPGRVPVLSMGAEDIGGREKQVSITLPDAGTIAVELFGSMPLAFEDRDPKSESYSLVLQDPSRINGIERAQIHMDADSWSATVARNRRRRVWIEHHSNRVTQPLLLDIGSSERQGPINLIPLGVEHRELSWTDGPIGWDLTVLSSDQYSMIGPAAKATVAAAEGTLSVLSGDSVRLTVQLSHSGSAFVGRVVHVKQDVPQLTLDLGARWRRPFELLVNGERPKGSSKLSLVRLGTPDEGVPGGGWVMLADGKSTERIPLSPGKYYFRLSGPESPGLMCGTCELSDSDASGDSTCSIMFAGEYVTNLELERQHKGVELITLDGATLDDRISADLRQFEFMRLLYEAHRPVNSPAGLYVPLHSEWKYYP